MYPYWQRSILPDMIKPGKKPDTAPGRRFGGTSPGLERGQA
jgi:hypothetical protein